MTHDSHESGLRTQKFSPVKSPVISPFKTRQLQYKKVSPAKNHSTSPEPVKTLPAYLHNPVHKTQPIYRPLLISPLKSKQAVQLSAPPNQLNTPMSK